MSQIAKIMKLHGPEYRSRFGLKMPENHKKVMKATMHCRDGYYGYSDHYCEKCYAHVRLLNCCGNRHCPSCQSDKNQIWLAKQLDKLLPTNYFMVTFTVPKEVRFVIRSNQKICYDAIFKASSETLIELASNPKFIGCDTPGLFGVLHTWGRQLAYHPHIHYVVPGGGLKDGKWISSKANYYVNMRAASKMFRGKFMEILKNAGLVDQVNKVVWKKDWVVDSQSVGDGQSSLKYLAPYVHRVAITDSKIESFSESHVTFKYKKTEKVSVRRVRTMKLEPMEFIRRFLQHTLPNGFMKIRYYGFLHPNSRYDIQDIREQICILQEVIKFMIDETPGDRIRKSMKHFTCRDKECGGMMIMVEYNFHPYYPQSKSPLESCGEP